MMKYMTVSIFINKQDQFINALQENKKMYDLNQRRYFLFDKNSLTTKII